MDVVLLFVVDTVGSYSMIYDAGKRYDHWPDYSYKVLPKQVSR